MPPPIRHRPPAVRLSCRLLGLVAVGHLVCAWGALYSPVSIVPPVWAVVFVAAALACVWACWRFTVRAVAVAGALTVCAYASRAGMFLVGAAAGVFELDAATLALGVAAWVLLAGFAGYVWLRALGPLAGWWASEPAR